MRSPPLRHWRLDWPVFQISAPLMVEFPFPDLKSLVSVLFSMVSADCAVGFLILLKEAKSWNFPLPPFLDSLTLPTYFARVSVVWFPIVICRCCIFEKLLGVEGYVLSLERVYESKTPLDSPCYGRFKSTKSNFPVKSVTMASSSSQSPATVASKSVIGVNVSTDAGQYSQDISRIPDFPTRFISHRRSWSEILSLSDDFRLYSDHGVVDSLDGPSNFHVTEDDLFLMYIDLGNVDAYSGTSGEASQLGDPSGAASLPVPSQQTENLASSLNDKLKFRDVHSYSLEGSTSAKSQLLATGFEIASHKETWKAILAAKLADLALIDPQRAKKIWANFQSAAKWKESMTRQVADLVRDIPARAAQLDAVMRSNDALRAENDDLKLRLQAIEQRINLLNEQNVATLGEVLRLTLVAGVMYPNASRL